MATDLLATDSLRDVSEFFPQQKVCGIVPLKGGFLASSFLVVVGLYSSGCISVAVFDKKIRKQIQLHSNLFDAYEIDGEPPRLLVSQSVDAIAIASSSDCTVYVGKIDPTGSISLRDTPHTIEGDEAETLGIEKIQLEPDYIEVKGASELERIVKRVKVVDGTFGQTLSVQKEKLADTEYSESSNEELAIPTQTESVPGQPLNVKPQSEVGYWMAPDVNRGRPHNPALSASCNNLIRSMDDRIGDLTSRLKKNMRPSYKDLFISDKGLMESRLSKISKPIDSAHRYIRTTDAKLDDMKEQLTGLLHAWDVLINVEPGRSVEDIQAISKNVVDQLHSLPSQATSIDKWQRAVSLMNALEHLAEAKCSWVN